MGVGGYTIDCVPFPAIAKLLIIMMIHVELMCCLHRVSQSIKSHSSFHVKACLHVLFPYLILPRLFSVMCTCVILATAITEYYPHWPDSLHRLVLIWFCSYTHIEKQQKNKKHLFGAKYTYTQTRIQSEHSLGSARRQAHAHPTRHIRTHIHTYKPYLNDIVHLFGQR